MGQFTSMMKPDRTSADAALLSLSGEIRNLQRKISRLTRERNALLEAAKPIKRFIETFDAQPRKGLDDLIYSNDGNDFGIKISELRAIVKAIALCEAPQRDPSGK